MSETDAKFVDDMASWTRNQPDDALPASSKELARLVAIARRGVNHDAGAADEDKMRLFLEHIEGLFACSEDYDFEAWQGIKRAALSARVRDDEAAALGGFLHVVFDGPPGPEAGRFVEVEDASGRGVSVGQWRQKGDYWHLVIPTALDLIEETFDAADDAYVQEVLRQSNEDDWRSRDRDAHRRGLRAAFQVALRTAAPEQGADDGWRDIFKLVNLVEELCDAVDSEGDDVGDGRGSLEILRDIGPALADAKRALPPTPVSK